MNLCSLLLTGLFPVLAFGGEAPTSGQEEDWFGKAEEPSPAATPELGEAALAAQAVADRLALVYDRATADAAAEELALLVPKLENQGGEETFWGRMHMTCAGCYGSPALQQVLAPILPPAETASNPAYAASLAILMDVWQTLEDISATLHEVQDKASADRAAEAITIFANHLDDCMVNGNSVPAPQGNRMDLVIYFYSGEYLRAAALYKEWGELQNRSGDYYGSNLLAGAMESLCGAMENLDQAADPYCVGKMTLICPQLEAELRHWLATAASVHDHASAEAAAPELIACAERMRALGRTLGRGYEKDLGHVSPMFLFLSLACDRAARRIERAGFYGSESLRSLIESK